MSNIGLFNRKSSPFKLSMSSIGHSWYSTTFFNNINRFERLISQRIRFTILLKTHNNNSVKLRRFTFIFIFTLFSYHIFAQSISSNNQIISDSFEYGYGNWNDGGSDCKISSNHASSGVYSVKLKDNSDDASSLYSDPLNLEKIKKISFSFNFYTFSMEEKENFLLEISTNGGKDYQVYQKWISGVDFQNYTSTSESLIINYDFSNNTVFRLRCNGSSNNDHVYIDQIEIVEGIKKSEAQITVLKDTKTINITTVRDKSTTEAIKIYPNPASEHVTLDLKAISGMAGTVEIYNLVGSKLSRSIFREDHRNSHVLPIDYLENGYYSVCVRTTDNRLHVMRLLVSN